MTTADQPNRDALTAALDAYGDAMRELIARVLSAEHDENPLERFLEPRTHLADVVAAALSDSDRDAFLERIQSGAAVEDAIEVADYPSIVESQWGLFRQHLSDDRGVITRMRRVAEVHAAVEDPLTGDLAESDVAATMTEVADLLELIGEHDQANEIRAQLRALAPREAAGSEQDDANSDPETDQRPEDQPTELDPDPAQNAEPEQLDEVRLSHMVLRHELTTLESARERLEADIADLKQAQQDTAAHVATQGHIVGEATSSLAELQQASLDPPVGVQSLASGRGATIVQIPLVGAALFLIVGVILAASLQGLGIVDLTTLPPQLGSYQERAAIADLQQAQEDLERAQQGTSANVWEQGQDIQRALSAIQRVESSLAEQQGASRNDDVNRGGTSATPTATPATPAPANASASAPAPTRADAEHGRRQLLSLIENVEPGSAVIMNTGADGMGPGGDGVGHYGACVLTDHYLIPGEKWPDGTAVGVVEIGQDKCFGWLLVDIDGKRTWVREEYVMTRVGDEPDVSLFNAANTELSRPDVVLKLAIFTDADLNKHWLFVEEHQDQMPDKHRTDSRGMMGTSWQTTNGHNDGLSFAVMDDHGRILRIGYKYPVSTRSNIRGEEVEGISHTIVYTRLGWFTERGIESRSYVEIFDLPVRIAADGTLQ